jgi:hypothetical protein
LGGEKEHLTLQQPSMGIRGQAAVMELFKELAYKFEIPFEEKCFEILQSLSFTNVEKVKPRAELDSSGIDLFGWEEDNQNIEYYFQCKGFQVKQFGNSQLDNCIKSIESFVDAGKKARYYYLIVNRPVSKDFKARINLSLDNLKSLGKVDQAELLDIYSFLDFVYERQRELFYNYIKMSFDSFYTEFVEPRCAGFAIPRSNDYV